MRTPAHLADGVLPLRRPVERVGRRRIAVYAWVDGRRRLLGDERQAWGSSLCHRPATNGTRMAMGTRRKSASTITIRAPGATLDRRLRKTQKRYCDNQCDDKTHRLSESRRTMSFFFLFSFLFFFGGEGFTGQSASFSFWGGGLVASHFLFFPFVFVFSGRSFSMISDPQRLSLAASAPDHSAQSMVTGK